VLATTGATALSAALLAACSDSDSGTKKDGPPKSSVIAQPADTSRDAKRGGTLKLSVVSALTTLDPHVMGGSSAVVTVPVTLSRLTRLQAPTLAKTDGTIVGDLAESMEFTPDRLQLTLKLRANAAFAPVAPVNGRLMDAQDVVYSWNRYARTGSNRSDFSNAANPLAPISSLTATDGRTIVIKLAYPDATIAALLSAPQSGRFNIIPREADNYDPRNTLIGTGPFYLAENTPSVRYVLKRNPGYYDASKPYIDTVEIPFVQEYATATAQFRVGAIYTYGVRQEDVLATKNDLPDLNMYQAFAVAVNNNGIKFGYKPTEKAMFRDERLRQAFSMSIDRDTFLDVVSNVSKFREQGIDIETRWHTSTLSDEYKGWWLDPRSKDFGPNAKYYAHDISEAKKLVSAAGFANGPEVVSNIAPAGYVTSYPNLVQVIEGMAKEAGFRFQTNVVDYNTAWSPQYRDARGSFEGIAHMSLLTLNTDPVGRMSGIFSSNAGVTFAGFDVDGKGNQAGDPYVDEQFSKARQEIDTEKRRGIIVELQRYLAKRQYVLHPPGGASTFALWWPAVRNVLTYPDETRHWHDLWIDETQKPLKKA
jgi:peptide/nickel transport system substrate-binding protein